MAPDPLDGCCIPDCDGDPFSKGGTLWLALCPVHYARLRRMGGTRPHQIAAQDVPEPDHGTVARYRSRIWKCRCQDCRDAVAALRRRERAR